LALGARRSLRFWELESPDLDLIQPHLDQLLNLELGFCLANFLKGG
jgi:hypothetical protein